MEFLLSSLFLSFRSKDMTSHLECSGKPEYPTKTIVTGNFLICYVHDSKPVSGERRLAIGCNALDHPVIGAGPTHYKWFRWSSMTRQVYHWAISVCLHCRHRGLVHCCRKGVLCRLNIRFYIFSWRHNLCTHSLEY